MGPGAGVGGQVAAVLAGCLDIWLGVGGACWLGGLQIDVAGGVLPVRIFLHVLYIFLCMGG